MTTVTMTADDFLTGILAGLKLRHHDELDVNDRRFDLALAAVYESLLAETAELDLDFQISPDPIHRDSAVIQEALSVAVQGRVVSRVNPTFRRLRINLSEERAERLLTQLPGGKNLYVNLTNQFLNFLRQPAEA